MKRLQLLDPFMLLSLPGLLMSGFFLLVISANAQTIAGKEKDIALLPNDTSKVNVLVSLGEYYCSRENQKALFYLQESLFLANKLNYKEGIAYSYFWQGRVYYYKDEYDLAKTCLNKSKLLFEELEDYHGLAYYYFATGSISHLKGDYINATKDFQEVVRLSKMAGDDLLQSAGLHGLASLHLDRNDSGKGLVFLRESLALKLKIGDNDGIATAYTLMGSAYDQKNDLDSSMYYYEHGLRLRSIGGEPRSMANSEVFIGSLLIKMKDYKAAIPRYENAIRYYIELDEQTGIIISEIPLALAQNYLGNSELAHRTIQSALDASRRLKNPSLVSQCFETLAKMAAFNGNFNTAYKYGQRFKSLNDSMALVNKEEIIQELEARYQLQSKNSQIVILEGQADVHRKNILILSISIGALMMILALIVVLFRLKSKGQKRQLKMLEQEKIIHEQEDRIKENERQLLEGQVEAKNRELAAKALEMLRINETIGGVMDKLDTLYKTYGDQPGISPYISNIVKTLENQTHNNSWNEFDKIFKNIHNEFYQNLLKKCPELTASEIKIAALLKLNLSTKEIAAISYKSDEGVKSTRYRLRKKLGLTGDDNLVPFLMKL